MSSHSFHKLSKFKIEGDIISYIQCIKEGHNKLFREMASNFKKEKQFEHLWEEIQTELSAGHREQLFKKHYVHAAYNALSRRLKGEIYNFQQNEITITIIKDGYLGLGISKESHNRLSIDEFFTISVPYKIGNITQLQLKISDLKTTTPTITLLYCKNKVTDSSGKNNLDTQNQVLSRIKRTKEEHEANCIAMEGENAIRVATGLQAATFISDNSKLEDIDTFPVDTFVATYIDNNNNQKESICFYNTNLSNKQELQNYLSANNESAVSVSKFGDFFDYPEYAVTRFEKLFEQGRLVAAYYETEYYYAYLNREIETETLEAIKMLPFTVSINDFDIAKEQAIKYKNTIEKFVDKYNIDYNTPSCPKPEELPTEFTNLFPNFEYYTVGNTQTININQ